MNKEESYSGKDAYREFDILVHAREITEPPCLLFVWYLPSLIPALEPVAAALATPLMTHSGFFTLHTTPQKTSINFSKYLASSSITKYNRI